MIAGLLPLDLYPPVATSLPGVGFLILFFAPIVTTIVLAIRYPDPIVWNIPLFKSFWRWGSISLLALGLFLIANGALDRSPANDVYASVISTSIAHGRSSDKYFVTVAPSLHPGRTQQKLEVGYRTFQEMYNGEPVAITVHKGLFGISWYSRIAPR